MKKNELLKKIRVDNGLSRSKIAKILDVSPVTIERYENNKLPINPELKYVQGICALYGYLPEIFFLDEITEKTLKEEYKLTKFSKSIRKYLYFAGYRENASDDEDDFFVKVYNIISNQLNNGLDTSLEQVDILERYLIRNFKLNNEIAFTHLLFVIGLDIFKPSCFFDKDMNFYIETLKNIPLYSYNISCGVSDDIIYKDKTEIINKLTNLEKNGLDLTIENIKKLSKYKELEELKNQIKQLEKELNITPAEVVPADNKASEICTLLEYAPEPFKDKLLNKLREYKKDIEEL